MRKKSLEIDVLFEFYFEIKVYSLEIITRLIYFIKDQPRKKGWSIMNDFKVKVAKELLGKIIYLGGFKSRNQAVKECIRIYLLEVSIMFKPYYIYQKYFIENGYSFSQLLDKLRAEYRSVLSVKEIKQVDSIMSTLDVDDMYELKTSDSIHIEIRDEEWNYLRLVTNAYGRRVPRLYTKLSKRKILTLVLEFMVYYYQNKSAFNYMRDKIFQLMGHKWNDKMIHSNQELVAGLDPKYLIDCFGGVLGVSMNIEAQNYIINDLDGDRINLYRCIKENKMKLISYILKYNFTSEDFYKLNQQYNANKVTSNPDYEGAASYFIRMCLCARNTSTSISENPPKSHNAAAHIDYILYYAEKLEHATILSMDVFPLLDWVRHNIPKEDMNRTLIALDPPYYDVSGYHNSIDYTEDIISINVALCNDSSCFSNLYNTAVKAYESKMTKKTKKSKESRITFENTPILHRCMVELGNDLGAKVLYYYRDDIEMNDIFSSEYLYYRDSYYLASDGIKKERIVTNFNNSNLELMTTSSLKHSRMKAYMLKKEDKTYKKGINLKKKTRRKFSAGKGRNIVFLSKSEWKKLKKKYPKQSPNRFCK